MHHIKTFIEKYTTISNDDWEIIQASFTKKAFDKNRLILEEGKICRHFYFLENGLLRFFYNIDGEDITKTFTIAPYCFTSRISFREQTASQESIETLEKTVVWQTDFQQYQKLAKMECWQVFMRKIINEVQDFTEAHFMEVKVMTAEERYKKLIEIYPHEILSKIPLKHLSSFLGIAPQSLSRIRKNIP